MFPGPLGVSLVGKALEAGIWSLDTVALRDFGLGRHRAVDDTPAGGGAGMVMRADVLAAAVDHARELDARASTAALTARMPHAEAVEKFQPKDVPQAPPLIYLSPRGEPLTQRLVHELADGPGVLLLAGRFEGIDERVIEGRQMREVSIGDYVLSGGELAAMVLLDAVVRLLPGVLGDAESTAEESFESGLLEYPQYTRPRSWEGRELPEVLLSGNHKRIAQWRLDQSEQLTRARRPDLWDKRATAHRPKK